MDRKIKLYGLILGIIYIGVITNGIIDSGRGFVAGFKAGLKAGVNNEKTIRTESPFYLVINAKSELFNGDKTHEFRSAIVMLPIKNLLLKIIYYILNFTVVFCVVAIPIKSIHLYKYVYNGDITNEKFIKKIKGIGVLLVLLFTCTFSIYMLGYYLFHATALLSDYNIELNFANVSTLMLGLVLLLLSEVLLKTSLLKEEQDLTI